MSNKNKNKNQSEKQIQPEPGVMATAESLAEAQKELDATIIAAQEKAKPEVGHTTPLGAPFRPSSFFSRTTSKGIL